MDVDIDVDTDVDMDMDELMETRGRGLSAETREPKRFAADERRTKVIR